MALSKRIAHPGCEGGEVCAPTLDLLVSRRTKANMTFFFLNGSAPSPVKNPVTGKDIKYFEIDIKPKSVQIYPNKKGMANFVGYDGMVPGPTIMVNRGQEAVVRFKNGASNKNNVSIHLHGSPSRAPFDGWAEDMTPPGNYKDYYYPNYQSGRMLWYHDHAMHLVCRPIQIGLFF
jgi:bilirubin oxidase